MWYLLAMFLVRGGTMSEQHPTAVRPTDDAPTRNRADIESDMYLANALIVARRTRQGEKAQFLERIDGKPALLVQELNWLHEEWAAHTTPDR